MSAYDPKRVVRIDDALTGTGMYMLHYRGRWEHVHGYRDGRDDGTSSRTPYAGDGLSSTFEGQGLRIYGVVGPKGGSAILGIDGTSTTARVSFYSATKRTHVLVYQSPPLSPGPHVFALVANGGQRHETYVNIDDVEIVR